MFKRRKKYRFILKSGAEFYVRVAEIKIKYKSDTMELTNYNLIDAKGEVPFHVSPTEIAAILLIH